MTTNDSEGRGALRGHLPIHSAPPELRDRIRSTLVDRLQSEGRPPWLRWAGMLAVAVLVFATGVAVGRAGVTVAVPPSATYALILYGGHDTEGEVKGSRAAEYGRWAASLRKARFVGGEELRDIVGSFGTPAIGASGGGLEPVAGFFLIDADDDATATAVARDCPHLKYGGRVVLQRVGRASARAEP